MVLMTSAFSLTAQAEGGAIGGGDVQFKAVVTCDAEGIDSTFPTEVQKLMVAAEVDFDGAVIENVPLTVVLKNQLDEVVNYLQTTTRPNEYNAASTTIYQWKEVMPGEQNQELGELQILGSEGALKAHSSASVFDELSLSNCIFAADAE